MSKKPRVVYRFPSGNYHPTQCGLAPKVPKKTKKKSCSGIASTESSKEQVRS